MLFLLLPGGALVAGQPLRIGTAGHGRVLPALDLLGIQTSAPAVLRECLLIQRSGLDHHREFVPATPGFRVPRIRRHGLTAVLELPPPGIQGGLRNPGFPMYIGHRAGIGRHHLLDDLGFELFAVPWHFIRSLRPLKG
jgi:hypothetical protein